ncbi:MAG: 50S ribosomal protein L10, partial [Acidimicrobiaceae bacterium]
MANASAEKIAVVKEVSEKLAKSNAAIITEYRGLSVGSLATLRRAL